jgi:hypothetical protein
MLLLEVESSGLVNFERRTFNECTEDRSLDPGLCNLAGRCRA